MTVLPRWARQVAESPPPGPFRAGFWRSPLRGPWFTAVLSVALLPGITLMFLTGLASYAAYNPNLAPGNDTTPDKGLLGSWLPGWPAGPSWLYWVNQGVHVTLGLVLIPIVLAKLWSVLPKLFEWPPARSLTHLVERASLLLLVGGAVFELVTGVMNIQYYYAWPFGFYQAHYYGAWVFMAAFVVHVAFRLPRMVTALRSRSLRRELRTPLSATTPEQPDPDHLVSPDPAPATISRRGALGMVVAGALALLGLSVGQSIGGAARSTALLAPRGQDLGDGPTDFQVNKTATEAGIGPVGDGWRLDLRGAASRSLSRAQLLALPQHTARLPIACVEGWSTGVQTWTGVRLADLAALVGAAPDTSLFVESLQRGGGFGSATLSAGQVRAPDALLALRVNGVDLTADHGFPARVVVPALPGVHNTKWVSRMTFQPAAGSQP
ncbi:MAG: molybdopterin-dependent oxidoreductase [Pseudonocardiales bacterium]|nr:molybdopterin-dependent oxidoreductase [Pseudonocardiales bacterium]MBV9030234.1 molybdopterin-dependent oxidoreductase [Pseudonocardiales bacterium]